MASARAAGVYSLYIEAPSGTRKLVKSANAAWWNVANLGSSEGTISTSATPEKWNYLPLSPEVGTSGYKIVLTYNATANTTLGTITKSQAIIPVMVNGTQQYIGMGTTAAIGNSNFTVVLAASASAFVAGVETPVFVVAAKENCKFQIGGDKVFLSLEDNS